MWFATDYGEPAEVLQVTEGPDLPVPAKGEVLIRATSRLFIREIS